MDLLTIIIPVYNEGESILKTLEQIKQRVTFSYNILLVYDTEDDTTLPAVSSYPDERVKLVRNRYGRGVLKAIKTGFDMVKTEYAIVTMADLSDPPEVMNDMLKKAKEKQAHIVCGSRYMRRGRQEGGPFLKGFLSRFSGLSLFALGLLPVHDPTNSFKLYQKSFLEQQTIESRGGFELGMELVVKAHKTGFIVCEVPTHWQDRVEGKSNFKMWRWLPHYLKWYFYAFIPKKIKSSRKF